MRCRKCCLSLAVFVLICCSGTVEADAGAPRTAVQKNVQRLLKTKTCPGCDLSGANLSQSKLEFANLEGANLAGAQLSLADLSGANLRKANLQKANLGGADLGHADLEGANLTGAVLEGAAFNGTRMKGRIVNRLLHADQVRTAEPAVAARPTTPPVAAQSSEQGARKSAVEQSAPQYDADAPGEAMTRAVADAPLAAGVGRKTVAGAEANAPAPLPPVVAANPAPPSAEAVNADKQGLIERMLDSERCIGCDLSGADLTGADLSGFDLERANFRNSNLREADLGKANLKGANFQNAQLQGADLSGADLYRADFSGADLTDADLEDAIVDAADFSGAVGVKLPEN